MAYLASIEVVTVRVYDACIDSLELVATVTGEPSMRVL